MLGSWAEHMQKNSVPLIFMDCPSKIGIFDVYTLIFDVT